MGVRRRALSDSGAALRRVVRVGGVPIVAIVLRVGSAPTADASYFLLAAYALLGRGYAIRAVALSWLFSVLSPAISPVAPHAAFGRYAVLAALVVSVFVRCPIMKGRPRITLAVMATVVYAAVLILHSLLFSEMPEISVLKVVSWGMAAAGLLAAWGGLRAAERQEIADWVFGLLVGVLLCSAPLLGLSAGYLVNGSSFQGILNQPQAFGVTIALLAAFVGCRLLAERRPSWWMVGLFVGCVIAVAMSRARTGGFAMLLGIAFAVATARGLTGRSARVLMPALRSPRLHLVLGLAVVGAVAASAALTTRVDAFVSKGTGNDTLVGAYDASRGSKIEDMLANIKARPWRGIGFGVASDPADMVVQYDPYFHLPIGASVEKGVMPLAVLEETGIPGAAAFLLWMAVLFRRVVHGASVAPMAVFFTALLTNFGESTLFSASGMGLVVITVIAWAVSTERGQGSAST